MRQMSSMHSRRCGNRSLTSVPHLPPGRNSQPGLSSTRCWFESPPPTPIVLPSAAKSFGLWSNVSMCDTPPLEKMKITRFAFAGKCGGFGASGSPAPDVFGEQLREDARAAAASRRPGCGGRHGGDE